MLSNRGAGAVRCHGRSEGSAAAVRGRALARAGHSRSGERVGSGADAGRGSRAAEEARMQLGILATCQRGGELRQAGLVLGLHEHRILFHRRCARRRAAGRKTGRRGRPIVTEQRRRRRAARANTATGAVGARPHLRKLLELAVGHLGRREVELDSLGGLLNLVKARNERQGFLRVLLHELLLRGHVLLALQSFLVYALAALDLLTGLAEEVLV
mmetsp:Transcript_6266/g.25132  ORF Transcript_6266/g.25132 Transcript_6266/m.25132 type:complete len:214 (+) Transcript_6266:6291-6932(+)